MDKIKEFGIGKIATMAGALLMIVGIFPNYMTGLASLEGIANYEGDRSLIQVSPICGVLIILTIVSIIVGLFLRKTNISLIGAGAGFLANILFTIVFKIPSVYSKITGMDGISDTLGVSGTDLYNDSMKSVINENVKCSTGFFLILIGSLIALAAILITFIKEKDGINEKIKKKTDSISTATTGLVNNMVNVAKGSWECESCHKENAGKSQFCVFCGQERPKPRVCPYCSTQLESHMIFCTKCGKKYDLLEATKYEEEKLKEAEEAARVQGKKICKYCGSLIPIDGAFCGKCGKEQ